MAVNHEHLILFLSILSEEPSLSQREILFESSSLPHERIALFHYRHVFFDFLR